MAPDLSEKLLGIDIDGTDGQRRQDTDETDEEREERERFVFFESGTHRLAVSVDTVRTLAECPDELTRVPRTPPAIEGMVDLRGEVTAVIDPSVHFPSDDGDRGRTRERLLVLDRPADQQSAAVRVDDVIGVEAIPVSDVLDESMIDERPFSGDALTHPLVDALIEQTHESEADDGGSTTNRSDADADADRTIGRETAASTGDSGLLSSTRGTFSDRSDDDAGTPFTVDAADTATPAADDAQPRRELIIEVTPVLDVDRLLQASGHRE
ncbi:chemotaxis protein CheW [Natronorubrum aibiense]|uniref:Chemotaxis protein CheW n=1 Tax=Natronorubrum aibiense TaxID=348826 RepID=A0A5P9P4C0_9EURY|nr:chemotaxis protein CheW [Natronorubrum aibiense]QFU82983.1 chemotaxis protein CheW [Natronorubrum aibiense]